MFYSVLKTSDQGNKILLRPFRRLSLDALSPGFRRRLSLDALLLGLRRLLLLHYVAEGVLAHPAVHLSEADKSLDKLLHGRRSNGLFLARVVVVITVQIDNEWLPGLACRDSVFNGLLLCGVCKREERTRVLDVMLHAFAVEEPLLGRRLGLLLDGRLGLLLDWRLGRHGLATGRPPRFAGEIDRIAVVCVTVQLVASIVDAKMLGLLGSCFNGH